VSVADKHGLDTRKQHWRKAEVAQQLYKRGVLPNDYSDSLRVLNEARKVATYEGDEPDFEGESLEDIAADVAAAVELAEKEAPRDRHRWDRITRPYGAGMGAARSRRS
jgi:hypothetical protein